MNVDKPSLVVYLLLALALMMPLLGPGYYLSLDIKFGPTSFAEHKFSDFYGYSSNPYGANLPFRMVLAALSGFLSVEILEKLVLFLMLFLCGFCMHHSLPRELGNSRYFGGLLYALNPFVFARFLAGHWVLLLSYAIWPLAIKYFLEFMKRPDDRDALVKVALVTMLASISSHGVAILLLCYLVIFVLHSLRSSSLKALARQTALLGILVLAMNLFWIVPTLLRYESAYSPASQEAYSAEFGPEGDGMPIHLAVLTLHGFWRGGFIYTKDVFDLWYVPYLLIVALGIIGFYALSRKSPLSAVSLLVIFISGFLLSLGGSGPASWLFSLFDLPIYFFFRDSPKFVGLIALVYACLGSHGVHFAARRLPKDKRLLAALPLLAIPLVYNYGFFGFLGQVGLTAYPQYWEGADGIIAADGTPSAILVLPSHLYAEYPWVNGTHKTLAAPFTEFFSKPVIMARSLEMEHIYSDWKDPKGSYMGYLYRNRQHINNTAELLLPLNARYILLNTYYVESIHHIYLFYREGGVPHIEPVFSGMDFILFRNNLTTGPFMASGEDGSGDFRDILNLSREGLHSSNVSYEMVTPAYYRVHSCGDRYLVYTRSYNSFIEFDGQEPVSWHGMGNAYEFTGPGVLENTLFRYVLALFLLSWVVSLVLILGPSRIGYAVLAVLSVLTYALAYSGMLKPDMLGGLLLLSVVTALCINRRNGKN